MPHLRFRGFDEAILDQYAPSLIPALATVFDCPEVWITMESAPTRFLTQPNRPMVEIVWFARGQSVQDEIARILYEAAISWVHPEPVVVFIPVAKKDYYEDGRNCIGTDV